MLRHLRADNALKGMAYLHLATGYVKGRAKRNAFLDEGRRQSGDSISGGVSSVPRLQYYGKNYRHTCQDG